MVVQDIMNTHVVTMPHNTPYLDVVKLFLEHGIHGAPVVDNQGTLIGVISEKDLLRALYPSYENFYTHPEDYMIHKGLKSTAEDARKKTVEHIMNKRLVSVTPNMNIRNVGAMMVATGIHRIPVINKQKKLIGMISRHHIYNTLVKETFHVTPATHSFAPV